MRRTLRGAVVVITGASSGIGRAAALAFANEGSRLVLAARNEDALNEVARSCEALGAGTIVIVTDTGDPAAVRRLAEQAEAFGGGRIDVWLNNAGVAAFGRFLQVPVEAHERVIRTNLLGYLYGAHAVLPVFERQGSGVLINLVSMAAFAPTPLASSYSASKMGNRGLFETLRVEFARTGKDIHVCDIYPAFVDTPMLEHTANFEGKEIHPVPPVIATYKVAGKIVSVAKRPRATVALGSAFPIATGFHTLAPGLFRWSVGKSARAFLAVTPEVPRTDAGLHDPSPGSHGAKGGWRSPTARTIAAGAGLGLVALVVGAMMRRREKH